MYKLSGKIALIIFVILTIVMIYLSVGLDDNEQINISVIEINGNFHLPKNAYYEYANLQEKTDYGLLNLSLIRDRFQKHPYIDVVTVEYTGDGKVVVDIKEKHFKALLLAQSNRYLMTNKMEVLPVLSQSQNINYPVIQITSDSKDISPLKFARNNEDLKTSFKILTAAKLLNPSLYDNLSEIDLRNGNNAIIYFSSVDYPVILGTQDEIKKMVVFEKLWESISTVQANQLLEYVDLRFTDKVYLGLAGENLQVEETQS